MRIACNSHRKSFASGRIYSAGVDVGEAANRMYIRQLYLIYIDIHAVTVGNVAIVMVNRPSQWLSVSISAE
jgi:hypothetical protein